MITIKRIITPMSVLFDYLIYKEKGMKGRLLGTAILVTGVILITLS